MNEKTIRWYETSYRRNLVDMHIDDWNEEFFSRFDPQAYFECLKMARIQSPMIYLHSHVGLCNWPSKSGRMHAGFKGVNQIGCLIDLCHSSGMDVVGYYSLIYNCWAYDAHPEWRMVDREGHNSRMTTFNGRKSGSRYGLVCPNNMEYRAFLFTQFDEFMEIYDVEGMFLDMTFWPAVCYCDACRNRFRTETGHDLPTVMDWNAPIWQSFQRKREEWLTEFAFACSNELKRLRPDIPVEHNQALFTSHWVYGNNGGVSEASDYCGGDLYGGPYEEAFICKLYYELTENQPFEYMTSRCDPNLTDHTSTKPIDVLRIHAFLALAHHGATMFIDAIDPDGTIHPETYAAIGKVFGESMQYERFLKGGMVSDVAIYFNTESKMDIRANGALFDTTNPEMDAVLGAAKTLIDERYLLTIIPSNKQRKIFGKKVVIVSEAAFLSDEEIDLFAAYVERGGCLYMSGSTSPKLSQRLLGLEFQGYTKETITYMAPTDAGQMIYGEMFSKTIPVAFKGVQMIVTNPLAQKVLATITLRYTDPADRSVLHRFTPIHREFARRCLLSSKGSLGKEGSSGRRRPLSGIHSLRTRRCSQGLSLPSMTARAPSAPRLHTSSSSPCSTIRRRNACCFM